MPTNFVFTLTAGRTGTAWLAAMLGESLPDCEAHHEILGYDRFGHDSPDLSHFTLFNSKGLCDEVRGFWERKFARVARCRRTWYVETSHVLMKAGLVEHLDMLQDQGPIHLVALTRDTVDLVASYTQRGDFANVGNQWLWYLDPEYPQNIVDPKPFLVHGLLAVRVWYCLEIAARQSYYTTLLAERAGVLVHRCDLAEIRETAGAQALLTALGADPDQLILPPPRNTTPNARRLGEKEREVIRQIRDAFPGDAWALGEEFYRLGYRLGALREP